MMCLNRHFGQSSLGKPRAELGQLIGVPSLPELALSMRGNQTVLGMMP